MYAHYSAGPHGSRLRSCPQFSRYFPPFIFLSLFFFSSIFLVPEGRKPIARGASPWGTRTIAISKPRRGERSLFRPSGACGTVAKLAQGLSPLAIGFRPSGAESGSVLAAQPHPTFPGGIHFWALAGRERSLN